VDRAFGVDEAFGADADEASSSTIDMSLHPRDGFEASITDKVLLALLKIMENEGGPIS
jgi:hypothetical protein